MSIKHLLTLFIGVCLMLSTMIAQGAPTTQITIDRVEQMPNIPRPFKILNFRQIATGYDRLAFDLNAKGQHLPLIWLDDSKLNMATTGFGLPAYVGPKLSDGTNHEAVACIASVLGSTLAGIDKSRGEHNWVQMCEQYYCPRNGEEVIFDRPALSSGRSFWYDTFSHILFYGLVDRYPKVGRLEWIMNKTADRWYGACVALGGKDHLNFDYTGFQFSDMQPHYNGKRVEPEGAAGAAWIEYMAWRKFGDPRHLAAARWCMDWTQKYPTNPYYEVVLTYGVTLAARMNAEEGTRYDVTKLLNWCFGPSVARPGWGVIVGHWGDYDVNGLSGSITDGGGYAFAMNSIVAVGAILPTARYDDRYARAIGKWALNSINNTRLFYPREMPAQLQSCPDWKGDPQGVICYEGLRKSGLVYQEHIQRRRAPDSNGELPREVQDKWKHITPFASGDPVPFNWEFKTDFALYGAGHVGMLAAIVGRTDDEHILQLDLLPTDFFHDRAYPSSLLYNPYDTEKQVHLKVGDQPVDVYDTVEKQFPLRNVRGRVAISIPADSARVLVLTRAGGVQTRRGKQLLVDDVVIDYRAE